MPAKRAGNSFVIQKHDATRLHYDLRLELDGVLKSWAVTRGPSLVPGEKRLAVQTEDHPLDYGSFEGTIPKGQYGGGTVLLWDRGTWTPEGDPHKGLEKGHLVFTLEGEKLRGAWHLVRMRRRPTERKEQWLLIKSDDEWARGPDDPDILEEKPLSVATGRDLADIAAGAAPKIRQMKGGSRGSRSKARAAASTPAARSRRQHAAGRKAPMPKMVEPCLATLVEEAPNGREWLHEIKWDGYRLLAFLRNGKTDLKTRNSKDYTKNFPRIAEAISTLSAKSAIIDGEAIVEDESGHSSFSALQAALSRDQRGVARQAIYYAFDLLYLDGLDLRALPLAERKAHLADLLAGAEGPLRLSEHLDGDGAAMIRHACRLGMEGIISKRRDRPYRSGRGTDWLKIKCSERQEFVIAGFTPSTALKNAVGSLILAYYEEDRLIHAGRTGTGFTADIARELYKRLNPLRSKNPPFSEKLSALQRRSAVWVRPELVAEVEFRGWTADDIVRHAAFKGLRDDKTPKEVRREQAAPMEPSGRRTKSRATHPRSGSSRVAVQQSGILEVAGVELTHPDRVLWAEQGLTKQGLAEFYEEIAEWVLPHLVNRPLALVRCPSGSQQGCFFQKHAWAGLTSFIKRDMVRDEKGEEEVLYIEDLKGLISLVQSGVLEIHPWGAPIDDVERPDRIVIDLDPGDGVAWPDVIAAAREARERLRAAGLESFIKTTGGKGLHVVAPLTPKAGWAEVKAFTRRLAEEMERDAPERYISTASKRERTGKLYIDYLRNGRGATAIAAYSTRARPGAPVATPIAWDELSPSLKPNQFTVANLPARLVRLRRDPWGELFSLRQGLPTPAKTTKSAKVLQPARGSRARTRAQNGLKANKEKNSQKSGRSRKRSTRS